MTDTQLTKQQLNFFNMFGYLHFPGLMADCVDRIIQSFERVWTNQFARNLLSKFGERSYTQCPYAPGDVLLFGCETKGLPKDLFEQYGAWKIPMSGPTRSLNLSNATAVVVYEALQTIRPTLFKD